MRPELRDHKPAERIDVGAHELIIQTGRMSAYVWLNGGGSSLLLALGDTRDEAVREAVERLEALTDALQQPSPAAIAAPKESR